MAGEPRATGAVVCSAFAGALLGLLDAGDLVANGFAEHLSGVELAALLAISALAVGAVGAVAGLVAAVGWSFGCRLGVGRPVVVAGGFAAVAGLMGCSLWLTHGSGTGVTTALGMIAGGALALWIALALLLSRRWCPRLLEVAVWLAGVGGLAALELRVLYSFSRDSAFAPVHFAALAALAVAIGCGGWLASARLRGLVGRRPGPWRLAVIGLIGAAIWGCLAVERIGSPALRLAIHERTTLTFRPLGLIPGKRARAAAVRADLAASCGPLESAELPREPRAADPVRGVVMLLVDTLRADRLGELTPNLEALSRRAHHFPNAYSPVPGTTAAIEALLAGRFEGGSPALTTALRESGVATVAVSGHVNLARWREQFDVFDDAASVERFAAGKNALTSRAIAGRAIAQLDTLAGGGRFFLLVHFYDPHAHYVANPEFDFGGGERARYDAEVAYMDRWIGPVLERIEALGDVAVIALSDHGEEFWEHRYARHQIRLYDESTRVPLIVAGPERQPARERRDVSLVDVAPTALELLGIDRPDSMTGRSLLSPTPPRPVFLRSANRAKWAVVMNREKLIFDRELGLLELYDLSTDPGELRNLADDAQPGPPLGCHLDAAMRASDL